MLPILAVSIVVLFVLGLAFVFSGIMSMPDSKSLIPKEEFDRAHADLEAVQVKEEGLKQQLDSLALQLHESQEQVKDVEAVKLALDNLRKNEERYQQELIRLHSDFDFLKEKADEQARKAMTVIAALSDAKQTLNSQLDEAKTRVAREEYQRLVDESQLTGDKLKRLIEKIKNVDVQVDRMRQRQGDKVTEVEGQVSDYKQENAVLKQGVEDIIRRLGETEAALNQAKEEQTEELAKRKEQLQQAEEENARLLIAAQEAQKVRGLQSQLERLEREKAEAYVQHQTYIESMQEELGKLQKEIEENNRKIIQRDTELSLSRKELQQAKIMAEQMHEENLQQAQSSSGAVIPAEMLAEHQRLQENFDQTQKSLAEVQQTNKLLKQREQLLKSELLKSRTQAMGLKKVCEGLKEEVERYQS